MVLSDREDSFVLEAPPPEMALPPFERMFEADFILPCLFYFALFRLAAHFVQSFLWNGYNGFKQYRLRNLSICLLHSCISGSWSFGFFILYNDVMMDPQKVLHWYEPWATHLPLMSIAYFLNDSLDMARHEISRWTFELFLHHAASIVAFLFAILPQKFIPYAYWALLMEVNSIFLHIRSMMQISGAAEHRPFVFSIVKALNIVTFVIFRFCVQSWQLWWAITQYPYINACYSVISFGGGTMFIVINSILFYRILCSDGLLGERLRTKAGTSRDDQTFVKAIGPDQKKRD